MPPVDSIDVMNGEMRGIKNGEPSTAVRAQTKRAHEPGAPTFRKAYGGYGRRSDCFGSESDVEADAQSRSVGRSDYPAGCNAVCPATRSEGATSKDLRHACAVSEEMIPLENGEHMKTPLVLTENINGTSECSRALQRCISCYEVGGGDLKGFTPRVCGVRRNDPTGGWRAYENASGRNGKH